MTQAIINAERRGKRAKRAHDRDVLAQQVLDAKAEFDRAIMRDRSMTAAERYGAWQTFMRRWDMALNALERRRVDE
jgi:hypothetical protein